MAESLLHILETLGRPRVLVIGDLILDRYVWGDAERISQEAPVILLRARQREERLGGAASVAAMLAALDAQVALAGILGADTTATHARELLQRHQIDHELVLTDPDRPSTLKERYVGRAQQKHPQQMLRVDYETREPIGGALLDRLAAGIESQLVDFDLVLISDYDKGACPPALCRRIIETCRDRKLPVLVDPIRGADYSNRYRGANAMTPNRLEASLASGIEVKDLASAFAAATKLRDELELQVGLVTLDKEGMVLVDRDGQHRHFPVRPREVYDITGAGDMVLAVLGLVLAAGYDYPEAVALANIAGGLEVERLGVATISRAEMAEDLIQHHLADRKKLLPHALLLTALQRHRQRGETVVFTNGCFDLLHPGHIHYLREARRQGHILVVGLNNDDSVRRLNKGPDRPVNDEASRAAILCALDCVDYVCLFAEDTPIELIRGIRPDVLVKGSDYRPDEVVGRDFVESYGGRLHLADYIVGQSTSNVLQRIRRLRDVA